MRRSYPVSPRTGPAVSRGTFPGQQSGSSGKPVTLDRLLSKLAVASRRTAQVWIRAGRVRVDGQIVQKPGTWVRWPGASVLVDDQRIEGPTKRLVLFHKPRGLVTTHRDEQGRSTIFDVLPAELHTLRAVGRLDQATSGLLLLTNDTALLNQFTDPANRVPRLYLVTVRGKVTDDAVHRATSGLIDGDEWLKCEAVTIRKRSGRESHLVVTLVRGKNREIRRIFRSLGHEVTKLRRTQFGPFMLDTVPVGGWKEVPIDEALEAMEGFIRQEQGDNDA